ncbi:hypothetical protein Gasu_51750 isoform 2 [Galdieria sulphuraria]|uniref:Uncharacterized protein n=1 Tax=Galdieria sulphuraria TaxID=130081 RepID=M2XU50_GALSU|nr:hypothetical protein Gasu_51750 isoform 2 [Galdieria sulphuraria]EME27193.1 hypothetical protein isoform 2 [Galdieria sulphuraria]|eukprot:XP_005703713.1 hypothetical protein isoform 2 [Galdieria sulphuraria]
MNQDRWKRELSCNISTLLRNIESLKHYVIETWNSGCSLQELVNKSEELCSIWTCTIHELEEETIRLRKESNRCHSKMYQLEEQLEESRAEEQSLRENYESETCKRKQTEYRLQQLEQQLKTQNETLQKETLEKDHALVQIQTLQLETENLRNKLRTSETEYKWLQNDFILLEQSRDEALQHLSRAKKELRDYREWRRHFEHNYESIQTRLESMCEEMKQLQWKLDKAENLKQATEFLQTENENTRNSELTRRNGKDNTESNEESSECDESCSYKLDTLVNRVSSLSLEDKNAINCDCCEQMRVLQDKLQHENEELQKKLDRAALSMEELLQELENKEYSEWTCSLQNALDDAMVIIKGEVITLDQQGMVNISKMVSKLEAYHSSLKNDPNHLFKVAHAIIKKSIIEVEYHPSKAGELWHVNDESLKRIREHDKVYLFRRLQELVIAYDNMDKVVRDDLITAREIVSWKGKVQG